LLAKILAPPPADFLHSNQGTIVGYSIWPSLALFAQEQGPTGGLFGMLWPLLAIGLLFWFLLIRPQQQEKRHRESMLSGLKKNDRVITVGGIYGVVTNVHREADEITIKVDETTNVKLRVTVGSIARVLVDESSDDSSSK
jgi:preprotein translocase subunit YajC